MNPSPSAPAPASQPLRPKLLRLAGLLFLFMAATGAGFAFERLGAPLPWMIGPLLLTATVFISLPPAFAVPNRLRPIGQIVVATQVGLAFSPAALDMLTHLAPVIVGTALTSGLCVFLVAVIAARTTHQSLAQTFLSAVPTSPVEAAAMATAAGLNPAPVIFSQTVRLSSVVLILPAALYAVDGWPDVHRVPVSLGLGNLTSIVVLAAIGVVAAWLFRQLRVPNPNFLGPLAVAALLSASGHAPTPYPPIVLAVAQIVLGTWLGATFRREFITSALWASAAGITSALLLLCSLCGVGIAIISGVDWRTLVLGAAPGGAVEMALTAKFLEQNVVLITTFHLVRIFILMPNIPWVVKLIVRNERRAQKHRDAQ